MFLFFFFQAEDGIRDLYVTGVQTCALPIWLEPLEWRDVPVQPDALGDEARRTAPQIVQLVLAPYAGDDAEWRAYRARRRAERVGGAYVASLSFRTVTYKALCAADQLAAFYGDLVDPALEI